MADLTLEDIAKIAGVSRSTVSRVVNNHPSVSESVRQRVLKVIHNTGYHPNAAARTLASQRAWMIGLVLPSSVSLFFTDPYFPRLTQGIAQTCNQYDYTLSLFLVSSKEDEEKIFPRVSRRGSLDGIIMQSGQIGDRLINRLVNTNIPIVIIGRPFQTENISYIDVNNVNGSYTAVRHLIRSGYQCIGTITGQADTTVGLDRKEGYFKALLENGREVNPALISEGDFTEAGGYHAMQKLLGAKPDAVFAASDLMAVGAMRATREVGLRIPEDIAFVGFDDLPFTPAPNPLLTTIRQPIYQTGSGAVEMLIELIQTGIKPARRVILETELVVRESCGSSHRREDTNL